MTKKTISTTVSESTIEAIDWLADDVDSPIGGSRSGVAAALVELGASAIVHGYEAAELTDEAANSALADQELNLKVETPLIDHAAYVTGIPASHLARIFISVAEDPEWWEQAAVALLCGVRAVREEIEGDENETETGDDQNE